MIENVSPITQAFLGTIFTWALTALGSSLVFVFSSRQRKILDCSLGFAGGVMIAASFWSLLAPAIEMVEKSGHYGENGQFSFFPISVGFALGAAFVWIVDLLILPHLGVHDPSIALALATGQKLKEENTYNTDHDYIQVYSSNYKTKEHRRRLTTNQASDMISIANQYNPDPLANHSNNNQESKTPLNWKRILLLIAAITIHNIPEGLAVGVTFGAVGHSPTATFESARNLAIGIGIQNFPEGLAVSLPLCSAGMSAMRSFWFGQLSGVVEPIAGVLGAIAVQIATPLLPYSLAFAAGAMIYVVLDDIIPEAQLAGNGRLASWGAMLGFIVMMSLDVGLG